jgi:hypothetical protein
MAEFSLKAERRRAMRLMKRNAVLASALAVVGSVAVAPRHAAAQAQFPTVGSDKSAAVIVFPKLIADGSTVDTFLQITNTSPHQIAARCFLINANSHCSNAGATDLSFTAPLVCESTDDCNGGAISGGRCIAGWQETDFSFRLTARQPITWVLSDGLSPFPLDGLQKVGPIDNDPTLPDALRGQPATNIGSVIPPAPEIPFRGELKCIQVDLASEQPSQGTDADNNFVGDMIGNATIFDDFAAGDARRYNAIGIQAFQDANDGDDILVLGREYAGCPSVLLLNHFFDDATEPAQSSTVRTTLTLVPCSENFFLQSTGAATTTVQLLIYNEFEQRWSRSTKVTCYKSVSLTELGSLIEDDGDTSSVMNVNVAGTLTGSTRIRPVDGNSPTRGDGLLALAEEIHDDTYSAAFNPQFTGTRGRNDLGDSSGTGGSDVINLSPSNCTPDNPCLPIP